MTFQNRLSVLYFAPTHSRKELEEENIINPNQDDVVYLKNIINNILEGTCVATLSSFLLINVSLGILHYLKVPIGEDSNNPLEYQPKIIGASLATSFLTNLGSGIYEAYRNRRSQEDVRRGNEILEEMIEDIKTSKLR